MTEFMRKSILLVEDEAIIALTESKQLEKCGYAVRTVTTGEDAVEAVATSSDIDLILMDINLGSGIDGTQAAEIILKDHDIPIVFLSSHTEPEVVEKTEKITSYGYVVKNSNIAVLDASIKMALKLFEAKRQIEYSEIKQKAMISSISDVIVIIDLDGINRYKSPNLEQLFGWNPDELLGKSTWDNVHPEDLPSTQVFLEGLNGEPGATGTTECRYLCKDGSYKWIEITVTNLLHNPVIRGFIGNYHDITEAKIAEKEIKLKTEELEAANEDLLAKEKAITNEKMFAEALLECLPGYLYVYNDQGSLIRWNKKHETMTGYSAEELSKKNMSDWFEGEDAVRVAAAVDEVFRTGYGEVEANLLIKGGGKLHIHSNGVKLTIDGKTYFVGVGIDITERKKAEEEIRDSEVKLKAILETSPDGVAIAALDGTVQFVTERSSSMWGYDRAEELIGRNTMEFIHPSYQDKAIYYITEMLKGNYTGANEYLMVRKDGSQFYSEVNANILHDEDNNPVGVLYIERDITERKKAEEEIQKQLSEKELLLREVHHRVKNNIATIESLLSLQAGSTVNAEVKAALQEAISRVQSTRVLYDKLLISKNLDEISIRDYAESLLDSLIMVFDPEKKITVETNIADFEVASKKAVSIGIIINELLTNVFKYAFKDRDSGKVSVSIDKEENNVTLIIQDNGVGIDERIIENKSPGFGLTIVKMLTEQLQGTITFKNDNGTHTTLEFPITVEQ